MFAKTAASWLEDEILAQGADNVAAFIAELSKGQAASSSHRKGILCIFKRSV